MTIDSDWSHAHTNKTDGRRFERGVVHVQVWQQNADGTFTRLSNQARMMSNAEMKKYGPLIKACLYTRSGVETAVALVNYLEPYKLQSQIVKKRLVMLYDMLSLVITSCSYNCRAAL